MGPNNGICLLFFSVLLFLADNTTSRDRAQCSACSNPEMGYVRSKTPPTLVRRLWLRAAGFGRRLAAISPRKPPLRVRAEHCARYEGV
jgi:hypothetical protein